MMRKRSSRSTMHGISRTRLCMSVALAGGTTSSMRSQKALGKMWLKISSFTMRSSSRKTESGLPAPQWADVKSCQNSGTLGCYNLSMLEFPSSAAPRFFTDLPLASGAEVELPDRVVRHLAVLRLRVGDLLTLFNGSGGEYECTLSRTTKNSVRARVRAWHDLERESGIAITLAQGLSGSDRMDYAMQKATELGVRAIRVLTTERSVVRLSDERADRRLAHWRHVVTSACEQCGRNRLPEVHPAA